MSRVPSWNQELKADVHCPGFQVGIKSSKLMSSVPSGIKSSKLMFSVPSGIKSSKLMSSVTKLE